MRIPDYTYIRNSDCGKRTLTDTHGRTIRHVSDTALSRAELQGMLSENAAPSCCSLSQVICIMGRVSSAREKLIPGQRGRQSARPERQRRSTAIGAAARGVGTCSSAGSGQRPQVLWARTTAVTNLCYAYILPRPLSHQGCIQVC